MTVMNNDLAALGVLTDLSRFLRPAVKRAFTPSPAIAQAVMAQAAQGGPAPGGPPPMGDPSGGMGGPGGPPGAPPGPPPGMDPNAAAAGGMPPPGPPPVGGPDPATQAAPPPGDPVSAKLDQLIQLMQQNQAGGGGAGANGKPQLASIKFEPAHIHQIMHDISGLKEVVTRLADAAGVKIDASKLLNRPAPAPASTPMPDAGTGAPPTPDSGAAPASQIATELPSLPPVAAKAARDVTNRLAAGRTVPVRESEFGSGSPLMAALRLARPAGR